MFGPNAKQNITWNCLMGRKVHKTNSHISISMWTLKPAVLTSMEISARFTTLLFDALIFQCYNFLSFSIFRERLITSNVRFWKWTHTEEMMKLKWKHNCRTTTMPNISSIFLFFRRILWYRFFVWRRRKERNEYWVKLKPNHEEQQQQQEQQNYRFVYI